MAMIRLQLIRYQSCLFAQATNIGRGNRIRTDDTLLPKQVRYLAALYPIVLVLDAGFEPAKD
jgi:hypothetical protein